MGQDEVDRQPGNKTRDQPATLLSVACFSVFPRENVFPARARATSSGGDIFETAAKSWDSAGHIRKRIESYATSARAARRLTSTTPD